jgi:hypothetical protein
MTAPVANRVAGSRRRRWRSRQRQLADRAEWRLTEHFFRAMFDFGILSTAGADSFMHMLLGAIGGLVAGGLLMTYIYAGKYAALWRASPDLYRHAVLGDDLLLIGLPMLLTAFVTLLVSHSLFPDERDLRILGPLPVRKAIVFGAKLTALILFSGVVIAVAHVSLVPLLLLTSIGPSGEHGVLSRLIVWAITSVSASMFAMLAVTAIEGLFVLALSGSRLYELTGIIRSTMLGLLVLCVPMVLRLPNLGPAFASGWFASGAAWLRLAPPAWFVGLQQVLHGSGDPWFVQLAGIAVAAVGAAAAIVAITYAVLFRRFERLVRRSAAMSPPWSDTDHTRVVTHATPAFRAVHRFTLLTLRRSQLHQSVLVGLSACGVGMAVNRLIDANLAGWLGAGGPPPSSLAAAAMWTPFGLMFVCGLGVRAALALPMAHRANWIFRVTEDETTRREQLRAVDRVVTTYVVGVPVATALPVLWITMGSTAIIAAAIVALIGFVFVHAVLLDWRRVPFTCSYLPGKRFVARSVLLGSLAFAFFPLTGVRLVHVATAGPKQALIIGAVLFLVAYLLRRHRFAMWRKTPLMFDDEFPDEPLQLQLGR